MKKILFFNTLIVLHFSCNKNKVDIKAEEKPKSRYDIECTTYWGEGDKKVRPLGVVKVDTINHIGSSEYYSDSGTLMERIVIIDKDYAMRLYYDGDTIALSKICRYRVRKNHPTKNYYSIVACYN